MSRPPVVVALGGGHGLAASLRALRHITTELTAVVTVADDGGSSGRLRTELGALPPGDLRMALAALAGGGAAEQAWAELFQHRYGGAGPLAGHAVGNLVLAGLAETMGSSVAALDLAAGVLGVHGRVLPLSTADLEIVAEVVGADPADPRRVDEVRGQVAVATTRGRVVAVRLEPADPPACAEAVDAVLEAEWVVLGPGSLFTSVIPHVLVPQMRDALVKTGAQRVVALNLVAQDGETTGYSPEAHLAALTAHVPDLCVDHVVADVSVLDRDGLMSAAAEVGAQVHFSHVAADDSSARHDPARLASAYSALMTGQPAPAGEEQAWR
ncbi:MAG TPA: uridine diphosphate-N-acetylglucosamine-binding protein YvcK [Mycobacteriales bacterium]|nr:uridine diphosphate-N-acetylglucosamine-binding protein YvcK [Mycobacteriales bacterium]